MSLNKFSDKLNLHDYLFHYNQYTDKWTKIPRDKINEYWNGKKEKMKESKNILRLIFNTP